MILLVDMDAFFASVEQLHHPPLRGRPVIVCGDPLRRGVVTAASYEARPFGIRSGMALQEARRLCPHAHCVEGNPEKYVALSLELLDLYLEFTPEVEPFSVDEAFLSVGTCSLASAESVASRIQNAVGDRFGLGATVGVGPNKLIAKMASGVQKPRGLTALDVEGYRRWFWPRAVRELWGVGPQLSARLIPLGIATVGDLAHAREDSLQAAFGVIGPMLKEAANGHDETPLVPYHRGVEPKSMGHEVTLPEDSGDPACLEGMLLRLSDQVSRRLRVEGYVGRVVCLKLRDPSFTTHIRQKTLQGFSSDPREVYETARELLRMAWKGDPVRLLGITVSGLVRSPHPGQGELFETRSRSLRMRDALDRVRDRLGEASVVPAGSLALRIRPRSETGTRSCSPRAS